MKIGTQDIKKIYWNSQEVQKIYQGIVEVYIGTPTDTQKWIDENPAGSQLGKIPLDEVGLNTSIVDIGSKQLNTKINAESDSVGLNTNVISVSSKQLNTKTSSSDEIGLNTGILSINEINLGE